MAPMQTPAKYRILVVDDDDLTLETARLMLEEQGYTVDTARSGTEAIEKIRLTEVAYALVILDYQMNGLNGADTARDILALRPELYILMLSGDCSREVLKSCWKVGAVGFIDKASEIGNLLETVKSWCCKYEKTYLCVPRYSQIPSFELIGSLNMVGKSEALCEVARKVNRYRVKKDNVLILGETGTGKEKVAEALHGKGLNSFFPVNCAAFNSDLHLFESELFGYVKGAFTGANQDHKGIFEMARGGTLFLDEIHLLSLPAQQKLLRVLQEKKIRPVGGSREYASDFRLIGAAKPELKSMVAAGEFLPDFYERLNVLEIFIPPLRERTEDIEPLVAYFCEKYEEETGERKQVLVRSLRYLEQYSWPRNVRELENTVRRLCIDSPTPQITPELLDARFFSVNNGIAPTTSVKLRLEDLMRKEVAEAIQKTSSQREAARRLGIPEASFRRTLKRFSIASRTNEKLEKI
jgi:DNA-binding NtrC family response regulator